MGVANHSNCGFCGTCLTCISRVLRGAGVSREVAASTARLNAWYDRRTAYWRAIVTNIMEKP